MKQMSKTQVFFCALVAIGLIGMMAAPHWVIRAGALLFTLLSGYAFISMQASRTEEVWRSRLKTQEQQSHVKLIGVVNRLRHDWMNDAQILFGYIQLKKFDNLKPLMEKIKTTMAQESNLSKLGIPSLVAYFLQLRVESKRIEVHVELEQEINLGQLPLAGGAIENAIRDVFGCVEACAQAEEGEAGRLSLEFDRQDEALLLDCVYEGSYDQEQLARTIRQLFASGTGQVQLEQLKTEEEEAEIILRIPYRI
ncbi:Spo0B domain-containing protein [Paenibacillus oryzisoli]|uniref:Spo0B domain-containing protein n=1 Tax=Paenibacillus oryzisoli TaxID=1850517 RepID=UPI003D296379